jgi:glycosyltransferase involved in cell wall biosynthesis
MSDVRITCIIPVHNGENYLAEAIQSVLDQTVSVYEIIVVDDGSTDGTSDVVATFASPVRLVRHARALGPAAARNRGIEEAEGDFVTFLDHDDLWVPHKVESQLNAFRVDPELDFCVGKVQNFWMPEVQHEAERFEGHFRSGPIPGYVSCTLMVRKPFLDRIGRFNTNIAHADDTDWFLRARTAGAKELLLDDVLLRRRLHTTNRSRVRAGNSRDEYLAMLKARMDARRAG